MASITLDFLAAHIKEPLDPDIDDLGRSNVITAKGPGGEETTVSLDTGPLGTASIGRNPKDVNANPLSDDMLVQIASNRLALATEPGPRYPTITVNLDAHPGLTAVVAALDVGDRLSLQSLPPELGRPTADTLVLGYTETIGTHSRVFAFNSDRGEILSHVGVLDGDASACLQTSGAQLGGSITDSQTSFTVATTSGPVFTTSPPAGAKIIVNGRDVMTVNSISGASSPQTFTVTRDPATAQAHASGASVRVYHPLRLTF